MEELEVLRSYAFFSRQSIIPLVCHFSGTRFFFYKNTWFQFQPAVSYFSVYFQPKVFLILFLIFVFEFPEQSSVKT